MAHDSKSFAIVPDKRMEVTAGSYHLTCKECLGDIGVGPAGAPAWLEWVLASELR